MLIGHVREAADDFLPIVRNHRGALPTPDLIRIGLLPASRSQEMTPMALAGRPGSSCAYLVGE
jgi:hypothetical protein